MQPVNYWRSGGDFEIGSSLLEVIVSLGIVGLLLGGIVSLYLSLSGFYESSQIQAEAAATLQGEMELVRNLPYEKVGTVGGIPAGILPQEKTVVAADGSEFLIQTTVRNIDDPFDGTVDSSPADTAPADYKLVQFILSCSACSHFLPLTLVSTAAPRYLEGASSDGALFIKVLDASGVGVSGATVRVINASTTPTIDLTDVTNGKGMLQLVGVPTSTERYRILVSRDEYSSDRTYPPDDNGNPNPVNPDATVVEQTVTTASFSIDRLSQLTVKTTDQLCRSIGGQDFSISGVKLIGFDPDVLKFTTSTATDGEGLRSFPQIEWDTYSLTYAGSSDLQGTIPLSPFVINPSSTAAFSFITATSTPQALLVTVRDADSGDGVADARVHLTTADFSQTLRAGRSRITQTDWSGGQYDSKERVETDSLVGSITMTQGVSGYSTTTTSWLISQTFDTGSDSSRFYRISWHPAQQPAAAGTDSLKFQLAANNDNATWNFLGPDGTVATYYTQSSSTINSIHNDQRYLRYKAYLETDDETVTPQLDDISLDFSGICVPLHQTLFTELVNDTYTVEADAPGYQNASTTVSVSAAWQQIELGLAPNP